MEIPAGEFKAKCLKLMEKVARTREAIVITKRGRPVAKLVPVDEATSTPLFGYMAGTAELRGDVVTMPAIEWSAETGDEDELYADLQSTAPRYHVAEPRVRRRHK